MPPGGGRVRPGAVTDRALRIVILGSGRMGRSIDALGRRQGFDVLARLGRADVESRREAARDRIAGADVALEFTTPGSAVSNIRLCVEAGCPVVSGTTGWSEQLPSVAAWVEEHAGALLWAPNFSFGAVALQLLAQRAAELFAGAPGFDTHVVETHHAGKLDAPSGTAIALEASLADGLGRRSSTTSIRTGHVPGTHEILIDGPHERLVLRHEARDRGVFAEGALRAAAWLVGRRGVHTMRDLLAGEAG